MPGELREGAGSWGAGVALGYGGGGPGRVLGAGDCARLAAVLCGLGPARVRPGEEEGRRLSVRPSVQGPGSIAGCGGVTSKGSGPRGCLGMCGREAESGRGELGRGTGRRAELRPLRAEPLGRVQVALGGTPAVGGTP